MVIFHRFVLTFARVYGSQWLQRINTSDSPFAPWRRFRSAEPRSELWRTHAVYAKTRRKMNYIWLVVDLPLWKIWKSSGIIIHNIWKNVPNHQSDILTTKQIESLKFTTTDLSRTFLVYLCTAEGCLMAWPQQNRQEDPPEIPTHQPLSNHCLSISIAMLKKTYLNNIKNRQIYLKKKKHIYPKVNILKPREF